MPRRPMHEIVAEEDVAAVARQLMFRRVADLTARAWAKLPGVEAIGVAPPVVGLLKREMPYWRRRRGEPSLQSLQTLDMVVWLSQTDHLRGFQRAFGNVLNDLTAQRVNRGMASHFLSATVIDAKWLDYRGVVCLFATCPKRKPACEVPGCGAVPFLRRYLDWGAEEAQAQAAEALVLWRRGEGFLAAASDLPPTPVDTGLEPEEVDIT